MKNSHQKIKQILVQTSDQIADQILTQQNQDIDSKYQNIVYCMSDRNKTVYITDHAQIDFVKAQRELHYLDWTYVKNGISFINLNNNESIFGHRIEQNKWHALSPIIENGEYTGYQRSTYTSHESFIDTVRLFFEEISWIETQSWSTIKWDDDDF